MRHLRLAISIAAVLSGPAAVAYPVEADIVWGLGGLEYSWGNGANSLSTVSNGALLSGQSGYTRLGYYNSDFASVSQCTSLAGAVGGTLVSTRKYGCRYSDDYGVYGLVTPATDSGPALRARGSLNATATTLTGTLTIVSTTDEPTGGTASSVGNGAGAANLRAEEGSPFGNVWYGISTAATLEINLTGSFAAGSPWSIAGGTARFSDPGFLCQQSGLGGTGAGTLCTLGSSAGGYSANGSHLSWGMDLDGGGAGTAMGAIPVRDAVSGALVDALAGAFAAQVFRYSVPYSPETGYAGVDLVGMSGEVRRGRSNGTCEPGSLEWDGSSLTCGALYVSKFSGCFLQVTADPMPPGVPACDPLSIAVVPVPPAAILFGSGLGLLAAWRRRSGA